MTCVFANMTLDSMYRPVVSLCVFGCGCGAGICDAWRFILLAQTMYMAHAMSHTPNAARGSSCICNMRVSVHVIAYDVYVQS